MMRSTIESLVKLPLDASQETSVRSKKEEAKIISINKTAEKTEVNESTEDIKPEAKTDETKNYLQGYIKYPTYDFL